MRVVRGDLEWRRMVRKRKRKKMEQKFKGW